MTILSGYTNTPLFGIALSILVMLLYQKLFARSKTGLLNPFLFSFVTIIIFLLLTKVPLEHYQRGGDIITFFLGPTIVSLAVPLYRHMDKLKRYFIPILSGIAVGSIISISSAVGLSLLFGLSRELLVSIAPKGVTGAIAMSLMDDYGGNKALAIAFVSLSGIAIYTLGAKVLDWARVKSPIARGVSLGTVGHASGTKLAFEMGEEAGAMSSLAIGLGGIITSFLMPLILTAFGL